MPALRSQTSIIPPENELGQIPVPAGTNLVVFIERDKTSSDHTYVDMVRILSDAVKQVFLGVVILENSGRAPSLFTASIANAVVDPEVDLVTAGYPRPGSFEVSCIFCHSDDTLLCPVVLFSKLDSKQFPTPDNIVSSLSQYLHTKAAMMMSVRESAVTGSEQTKALKPRPPPVPKLFTNKTNFSKASPRLPSSASQSARVRGSAPITARRRIRPHTSRTVEGPAAAGSSVPASQGTVSLTSTANPSFQVMATKKLSQPTEILRPTPPLSEPTPPIPEEEERASHRRTFSGREEEPREGGRGKRPWSARSGRESSSRASSVTLRNRPSSAGLSRASTTEPLRPGSETRWSPQLGRGQVDRKSVV